jgi:hypothetical protein
MPYRTCCGVSTTGSPTRSLPMSKLSASSSTSRLPSASLESPPLAHHGMSHNHTIPTRLAESPVPGNRHRALRVRGAGRGNGQTERSLPRLGSTLQLPLTRYESPSAGHGIGEVGGAVGYVGIGAGPVGHGIGEVGGAVGGAVGYVGIGLGSGRLVGG